MDHSRESVAVFNKLASLYQEKYVDISAYHAPLNLFLRYLKTDAAVLDIACGPGNITRYLLRQNPGLTLKGIDLAPQMIEIAKQACPQAVFEVRDAREIHQLSDSYDGIVIGFCLPYLHKTEAAKLIADAASRLKPGGVLYLSTIDGLYEDSGYRTASTGDSVYMYYYSGDDLAGFLRAADLHILWEDTIRVEGSNTRDTDRVLVAQKTGSV